MANKKETPVEVTVTVSGKADRRNAVDAIRDNVLNLLSEGNLPPWAKPWDSRLLVPRSFATGQAYRGWNMVFFLFEMMEKGYDNPFFISKGDARKLGINVPYGNGDWLWGMYYGHKEWTEVNKETGVEEEREYFFPKAFQVLPYDAVPEEQRPELPFGFVSPFGDDTIDSDEAADNLIAAYFDKKVNDKAPSLSHGGNRAFYVPGTHSVTMPKRNRFESAAGYYKTFFHEMIHSTGHNSLLQRFGTNNEIVHASDHLYSFEELVAEMGAMMLVAHVGLSFEDTTVNSAAYIAGWAKSLKDINHKDWITKAATKASKAVDIILEQAGFNTDVYKQREWEEFKDNTGSKTEAGETFSISKVVGKTKEPVKKTGRRRKTA